MPSGNEKMKGEKIVTVRGRLKRVLAIGGETTGWAIELDSPLDIDGLKLSKIEVDPHDKKIDNLDDMGVEITGSLEKHSGLERAEYWVIIVTNIRSI